MKKLLICLLAVGSIFCLSGMSFASVKAGDKTLTIGGSYTFPQQGDSTWQISGNYGYFFTNAFQLEGGVGLQGGVSLPGMGISGINVQQIQVRPNFHFNTQANVVPYIGATLGWQNMSVSGAGSSSDFIYGVQAGLKTFIKENAFLQVELNHVWSKLFGANTGSTNLTLGMGFKF